MVLSVAWGVWVTVLYKWFESWVLWIVPYSLIFLKILQNRAGLRHFLGSFGGTEQSVSSCNPATTVVSQESSFGSMANEKQDPKARPDIKFSQLASGIDSSTSMQSTEMRLADLLDSTLWNRRLAPSSERIVYALVQQIFHGIREYFLASAELKVCIHRSLLNAYFGVCCSCSLHPWLIIERTKYQIIFLYIMGFVFSFSGFWEAMFFLCM